MFVITNTFGFTPRYWTGRSWTRNPRYARHYDALSLAYEQAGRSHLSVPYEITELDQ